MVFVYLFECLFPTESMVEDYNKVIAGTLVCPESSSNSKTPHYPITLRSRPGSSKKWFPPCAGIHLVRIASKTTPLHENSQIDGAFAKLAHRSGQACADAVFLTCMSFPGKFSLQLIAQVRLTSWYCNFDARRKLHLQTLMMWRRLGSHQSCDNARVVSPEQNRPVFQSCVFPFFEYRI